MYAQYDLYDPDVYLRGTIIIKRFVVVVDQVSACQKFNICSDTVIVINVKLCMVTLLVELYLFTPLSLTVTIFQGHSKVEQF